LFRFEPTAFADISVELDLINYLVGVAYALKVFDNLFAFWEEGSPAMIGAEREGVEDCRAVTIIRIVDSGEAFDSHITSNTRISIDPPGPSDARLTVKNPELVCP
jgi:hypothetical protein